MKKLSFVAIAAGLLLAGVVIGLKGRAPLQLAGEAQAQNAPRNLAFDQGIGFYYSTGGQLHWLGYPVGDREKIRDQCIEVSKSDFKLYSFGIDFSKNPLGLPPHLTNFCVVLFSPQYSIDNPDFISRNVNERQGPYAVHFLPVPGAGYPTYEITCDLWPDLGKKVPAQGIWGFRVRDGVEGQARPLIYWFVFKDGRGPEEDNVVTFGN